MNARFAVMAAGLATIHAQLDGQPLDAEQWAFLARLHDEGQVEQRTGIWLGDLLHKGLVQPVSEASWTFALTAKGAAVLAYHPESPRKKAEGASE